MRRAYESRRRAWLQRLYQAEADGVVMAGITDPDARATLVEQLVDSVQRQDVFHLMAARSFTEAVADPRSPAFHPVKSAVWHYAAGRVDEAGWMVFLYVHFGKHARHEWSWPQAVYGRLGSGPGSWWDWIAVSSDPTAFQYWLAGAEAAIKTIPGGFGNHRKYQSLDAWKASGTGEAVVGYVDLVERLGGSHAAMFQQLADLEPEKTFDRVMRAVRQVPGFGRTAGFDYTTALARLGFIVARAPHTYMAGATGPLDGTRLLFQGSTGLGMSGREAQASLVQLSTVLQVSPEVLEDAVCNWQKSPLVYVRFSG